MNWTPLNFGKHEGKTLPQVMFEDADWFFDGYQKGYFKNGQAHEAREIYRRSRSIRVPQRNGQRMLVEYVIDKPTGKFGMMRLIPDGTDLEHLNASTVIDFFTPRAYAGYDKTGYKNFVLALKAILFGSQSHRMSKQAREGFFNDDRNFKLANAARTPSSLNDGIQVF
jgi:hypothetical protein